jgi:hypothetical protein
VDQHAFAFSSSIAKEPAVGVAVALPVVKICFEHIRTGAQSCFGAFTERNQHLLRIHGTRDIACREEARRTCGTSIVDDDLTAGSAFDQRAKEAGVGFEPALDEHPSAGISCICSSEPLTITPVTPSSPVISLTVWWDNTVTRWSSFNRRLSV